jgi:hypothetical protein
MFILLIFPLFNGAIEDLIAAQNFNKTGNTMVHYRIHQNPHFVHFVSYMSPTDAL